MPCNSLSIDTSTPRSPPDTRVSDSLLQQPNSLSPPSDTPWLNCVTLKNIPSNVTFKKISRLLTHLGTVSVVYILSSHPSHPARIQQSPGALFPPHLQWKTVSPAEICTAIVSFTEPTVTTSVNITSKCLHMKKRKVLLYHTKQSDYLAAVNNPSTIVLLPSPQITQESLSSLSTIIQPKDSFSIVLDGIPRSETLLSILSRLPSFSLTSIRVLPSSNIQPTFLHNLHAANHPRSNFQLCVLEFLTLDELDRCYKHLLRTPLYPSASIVSPSMPAHDKEEATVHPNFSFFPPLDTLSQTDLQNPTVPPFPDPDSLRLPLDGLRNQLELALTPLHFSNDTQSGASGSSHYFQPSPDPYCYF